MSEERAEYGTALVTATGGMSLMQLGDVLSKSGYFADAKGAAQAIVKVLCGQEMGFLPIASMTGIHIINGKPAVGATLQAAAIKRSGRYNYRVKELTDETCAVEFLERNGDRQWDTLGVSTFTMADARRAQVKNMDKFPRNMLFARAVSNGAKWYCPDIFGGPVYTPDELGATVDYETGEIITSTATDVTGKATITPEQHDANKRAFFQRVLAEVPYYNHVNHVAATLRLEGFTAYDEDAEQDMWDALQKHANAKANAAAAGGQTIAEQMDAPSEAVS